MASFIRRHAVVILFVIVIVGLGGAFRRTNQLIDDNKRLAITTHELTVQLEATVKQRRLEICAAETQTRDDIRDLMLRLADLLNDGLRTEMEARIHQELDQPSADCPPT